MRSVSVVLAASCLLSAASAQYIEKVITTPVNIHGMQYDSTDNRLFCAGDSSTMVVIGGAEDSMIAAFRAPGVTGINNWVFMCYDVRDNRIYWSDADSLVVRGINAATYERVAAIPVGTRPQALGWNPVNNRLYCSCEAGGQYVVQVIDCASGSVVAQIQMTYRPDAFCFDTHDNKVYCTERPMNVVQAIDAEGDSVIATIPSHQPAAMCYNPLLNRIYWGDDGADSATVVDCAADTVIARVPTGSWAMGACFNPRNNKVYFGAYASNNVTVIDCATNQRLAAVPVDGIPWVLIYDPHTNAVYCASRATPRYIKVIDGVADSVVSSITYGDLTVCAAFNPIQNRVYFGSEAGLRVTVIQDSGSAATEETPSAEVRTPNRGATIVRGVLRLPEHWTPDPSLSLLNSAGQRVMMLGPGDNDVSAIPPGVYFVRRDGLSASRFVIAR